MFIPFLNLLRQSKIENLIFRFDIMSAVDLSNLFTRCFELADGSEIIFHQSVIGDVGCVVWDAALVLCGYFVKCSACPSPGHSAVTFEGKCVLEVGSGTGAVGLVAACLG